MDEDFPDLPEDNHLAFMTLESEFRADYEKSNEDQSGNWQFDAAVYMSKTLAAAEDLGIEALDHYGAISHNSQEFPDTFWQFYRDVDSLIVRMRIQGSRRSRANSVGFSEEQKTRIHALIEKIRTTVEESSAAAEKKEKIFAILANLASEVSRSRTALARFGDLARGLAGISKDLAEEGAEPWWKWAKLIFGEVDDAKNVEPQLPTPKEVKRIEPPRRDLPKLTDLDRDDGIPM